MRNVFLSILVLLVPALLLLGYFEYFAPTTCEVSTFFRDPGHWGLQVFSARSRILGRNTLHLVVISRAEYWANCDGHVVVMRGRLMKGRGKVFLIDEYGTLRETGAPIFQELLDRTKSRSGLVVKTDENGVSRTLVRDWLREWFPPARRDEPLATFLADDVPAPPPILLDK